MIAVVGDAGIDRIYELRSLNRGATHRAEKTTIVAGGGSANTAAHAAIAGAPVHLFAAVGSDESGEIFRSSCRRISRLQTHLQPAAKTQESIVLVEPDGARTIVIGERPSLLLPRDQDVVALRLCRCAYINLEDGEARQQWSQHCPGYRVLPVAHLASEAARGTHWDVIIGSLSDHHQPAPDALLAVGAELCLMTDGAAGGAFWTAQTSRWNHWSSPTVRVVDSLGAGDAFLGGVLAAERRASSERALIEGGVKQAAACLRVRGAWPA